MTGTPMNWPSLVWPVCGLHRAGLGWGTWCMNSLPAYCLHDFANNQHTSSSMSTNNPLQVSCSVTSRQGQKIKTPFHPSSSSLLMFSCSFCLLLSSHLPSLFTHMPACASTSSLLHFNLCYKDRGGIVCQSSSLLCINRPFLWRWLAASGYLNDLFPHICFYLHGLRRREIFERWSLQISLHKKENLPFKLLSVYLLLPSLSSTCR